MKKNIVIVGGGPAGIEAAKTAAQTGIEVALVTDSPIGGRAGWHSLLPSKVWLAVAEALGHIESASNYGPKSAYSGVTSALVTNKIKEVKQNWNNQQKQELSNLGVELIQGTASFKTAAELEIKNEEGHVDHILEANKFIIASGSVPVFPSGLKPDGQKVIAPRFMSHLDRLPQSIIVIGAGPTGCESAYLFNRIGAEVTWIVDQFGLLPSYYHDAGLALGHVLVRQGVHIVQGQMVENLLKDQDGVTAVLADGSRYTAEMAFVAIGRHPDWDRLNFQAAGLTFDAEGRIGVNEFGQTEVQNIYLVGDADNAWMIANKAMAQANIAAKHASGVPTKPYRSEIITQVTFTNPQVAQIGDVRIGNSRQSSRIDNRACLKAHINEDELGFFAMFFDETNHKIHGAVAVGSHAAATLTPIAVAIQQKATIEDLAEIYGGHPTFEELPFIAARAAGY